MRFVPAVVLLAALFAAGCTENNYYPLPQEKVPVRAQILSPASHAAIETIYRWGPAEQSDPESCPFAFCADTTYYARIHVNSGGDALTARVYQMYSGYYWSPIGDEIYPFSDTFDIPFLIRDLDCKSAVSTGTSDVAFYVSGLTIDSTVWFSDTVHYQQVIRATEVAGVPQPPMIRPVTEDIRTHNLSINWCNSSPAIVNTAICFRREDIENAPIDSFRTYPNWGLVYRRYQPLASYVIWLYSTNEHGHSISSDTMRISTGPVNPPAWINGFYETSRGVTLYWPTTTSWCDTVIISRRDCSSDWSALESLPVPNDNSMPYSYNDYTAVGHCVNFYRVGFHYQTGTWWSADSAGVWVP